MAGEVAGRVAGEVAGRVAVEAVAANLSNHENHY